MSKYFIEYTKHKLIISCDVMGCYNLLISEYDSIYAFIQFVYPKKKMYYGIRQVIKLKNNDSLLHKLIDICIDKYLNNPSDKKSFKYVFLTDVFKDNDHIYVYFSRSNSCYDPFAGDILVRRIKTKVPLLRYDL